MWEARRQHLLGYYATGELPVIQDSARLAGELGDGVLIHEQAHQHLTLETPHGQFAIVLDWLYRRRDVLPHDVAFNIEHTLNLLFDSSLRCQEGFATWRQLRYLLDGHDEYFVRQARCALTAEYREYCDAFHLIACEFAIDGNWLATSSIVGAFARVALASSVFSAFNEALPRYDQVKTFLADPINNPDMRLQFLYRSLASPGAAGLREAIAMLSQAQVHNLGKFHDHVEWYIEPTFHQAALKLVAEWALTCSLPVDMIVITDAKLAMQADTLRRRYAQQFGVVVPERVLPLNWKGAHRFQFDTFPRDRQARLVQTVAEAQRDTAAFQTSEGFHERYLASWAFGAEGSWAIEVSFLAVERDTHGSFYLDCHDAITLVDLSVVHLTDALSAASSRVCVIPSVTLFMTKIAEVQEIARTVPTFIYLEFFNEHNLEWLIDALGSMASFSLVRTWLSPLLLVIRPRLSSTVNIIALIDPSAMPEVVHALVFHGMTADLNVVSLETAPRELLVAFWICAYSSMSGMLEVLTARGG